MKKSLIITIVVIVIFIGGILLSRSLQKKDTDIISRNGMHWHPQLQIIVAGEKIEIPQNVGIGAIHSPMHTHEDLPLIHLEFDGLVRSDDIKLGQFFRIWDKDMNSFGTNMRMTVNGKENTEFGNYIMHDGDKIELHYN